MTLRVRSSAEAGRGYHAPLGAIKPGRPRGRKLLARRLGSPTRMLCWGRGRPRQRVLLVAHPRQRLPGVPPALFLPVLRRLGRLGRQLRPPRPSTLHPQAARHPPDVDRPARARGGRALSPRPARWARAERSLAHRGHGASDARGVEGLTRTPTERWVFIEDIGSFPFEGTRVFTAPDFGYWSPADRLQLLDWKTGGGGGESAGLQLGGYALYALEVLGVDLARVDLLEVNLREGKVTSHPWDEASLDRVREHIRLSVRSMKAYLKDPERNLAEESGFEKTEELRICRWCNFRAVCRPDLAPFAAAQEAAS